MTERRSKKRAPTKRPARGLKVGIVCYPTFGGSGVVATELGLNLIRRGHEVHFICYSVPLRLREYHSNLYYHVVDVLPYPLFKYSPYDLALASTLVDVVKKHKLEIVHVHYAVPHSIAAHLAREMVGGKVDFRTVTTLHGTDITIVGAQKSYRTATKFGIERSDGVTAVSQSLADATKKLFGDVKPIEVIPNSVNLSRFKPVKNGKTERRRLAKPDEKILVHASNFRPVKRVPDVVRIFDRVRKKLPARLVLLGDGPEMSKIVQLVDRLGLRQSVTFFGPVEDIENVLPYTDLFLLPSGRPGESFGLAALESMACGVPVVATDYGGIPEVIDHGVNGYLCDVGDVECMSNLAIQALSDGRLHARLRRAARRKAETAFQPETITQRYEELYFRLLDA